MRRATSATLAEFVFESRLRDDLPVAALMRLAREAGLRNRALGLTGVMRFEDGRIRQVVEGPCDAILVLASAILADPRHEAIEVRSFGAIETRRHSGWSVQGIEVPETYCALRVGAPVVASGPVWLAELDRAADRGA